MPGDSADTEITLQAGDLRLKVSPYGAALRGLWRAGADGQLAEIITGYTGARHKIGGQGDVLIPFPGRIHAGRYTFAGQTHQMAANDKDGPNAIHGFLRLVPWQIAEQTESRITFAVAIGARDYQGYPFALEVAVTYLLDEHGLTCRATIENTGEQAAPVGAGFHPYFTVGSERIDDNLLHVPMTAILEMEQLIPTGRVLPVENTAYDFRRPRTIGTTHFNTCYLNPQRDPDGLLRLRLADADNRRAVTVWLDSNFNYVVLFSGDGLPEPHRRRALAIEPMTCGADAFNHPEWGLIVLNAGQSFSGTWGVVAE